MRRPFACSSSEPVVGSGRIDFKVEGGKPSSSERSSAAGCLESGSVRGAVRWVEREEG